MKLPPPLVAPAASYTVRRYAADCLGKEAFDCFGLASKVAGRMRRRGRAGGPAPYRCQHCGQWHIGTGDPKRRRDR